MEGINTLDALPQKRPPLEYQVKCEYFRRTYHIIHATSCDV